MTKQNNFTGPTAGDRIDVKLDSFFADLEATQVVSPPYKATTTRYSDSDSDNQQATVVSNNYGVIGSDNDNNYMKDEFSNINNEFNELIKSFGGSGNSEFTSPVGKVSEFSIDDIEKIIGSHSFLDE